MPHGLLIRVHNHIAGLSHERRGSIQGAEGCVIHDMLYGNSRPLPRRDDRAAGQPSTAEIIGQKVDNSVKWYHDKF